MWPAGNRNADEVSEVGSGKSFENIDKHYGYTRLFTQHPEGIQGVLDGLNRLKEMVIPADHQEGGTMIIPGHGRLSDAADLAVYHQMVTIVRDRLQDMIKRGMTLEQIMEARPSREWDARFASESKSPTTGNTVQRVYTRMYAAIKKELDAKQ